MDFYYANICKHDMKRTWQGYGVRLCLRLMLNKLKEMKVPIFIYILLGPTSSKVLRKLLCVHEIKKFFMNHGGLGLMCRLQARRRKKNKKSMSTLIDLNQNKRGLNFSSNLTLCSWSFLHLMLFLFTLVFFIVLLHLFQIVGAPLHACC
jgi:hypothetical protein